MSTIFRQSVAAAAIKRCREVGVALVTNGTGVHAIPHNNKWSTNPLDKHPALKALVREYRDEIRIELDKSVE